MADLGEKGQEFFDALAGSIVKHEAATRSLLVEAARIVDRLEALDDIVAGKGVLPLLRFRLSDDEGRVAEVKFDAVLSEARQQQANFGAIVKAIMPNLDEDAGKKKGGDLVDQIAQRRAARKSGPAKGQARAKRPG